MKGKMIASIRNFAQMSAVQGFERIGITTKELTGVSASAVFEAPAPSAPADISAARLTAVKKGAEQAAAERLSAGLN